ncbi:phospho-N-acetylmuramoyl-pentapeptide-transferase [Candidatus Roizmanbacteria bacterium]|nr:phospho-N-acetylmuramoyl-pentapeptide-transferase [Candidatus Roizmanbacteria bacterium]
MAVYFFALFISFIINSALIIPFINFLYRLKFQRVHQKTRDVFNKSTPVYDRYHSHKTGTPVGGGLLTVITTVFLFSFFLLLFILFNRPIQSNYPSVISEIKIILFAFISFALLGIYDDLRKIFFWQKDQFFGLRLRHKLLFETALALIISYWLFSELKIDIVHIPFFGVYEISYFYILFSAFTIVAFANAVNIADGLDGLAAGVLMIALASFWIISRSILDVPSSLFIGIWLGGLIAFLYFNIWPARLHLGDAGALSFGATFAVIGLILGKAFSLSIIGGVFVIEIASSLIQLIGKKFLKRKIFPVAPLHLWLQLRGWEEPKIVMRFWVISILFSVFGLMLAFLK